MTSDRLKNLAKCRLILSVIAVLLAGLMIVSGVMCFRPQKVSPSAEEPTESTAETINTTVAETTEETEAEETTAETTEPTITEETVPTEVATEEQQKNEKEQDHAHGSNDDTGESSSGTNDSNTGSTGNQGGSGGIQGGSGSSGSQGGSGSNDNQNSSTPDNNQNGSSPDNNQSSTSPDNNQSGSSPDNNQSGSSPDNNQGGSSPDNNQGGSSPDNSQGGSSPDNSQGGSSPDNNQSGSSPDNNQSGSSPDNNQGGSESSGNQDPIGTIINGFFPPQGSESQSHGFGGFHNSSDTSVLAPGNLEKQYDADIPVLTEDLPAEAESSVADTKPADHTAATEHTAKDQNISIAPGEQKEERKPIWGILFWGSAALLAADLVAILLISHKIEKEMERLKRMQKSLAATEKHARRPGTAPVAAQAPVAKKMLQIPQVGTVHQVGRRDYQQDSLGHASILGDKGFLAVLADGMGGLSNGEKVSQKIVMDALAIGHQLKPDQLNGALRKMVDKINENANHMLGSDGLYKSGSTLIAILSCHGQFQWISVGDSRIYLYRKGYANQLNQDHDQLQTWMADVLSGRMAIEEALRNPDGRKLTSFVGMGQLKHIDGSHSPIPLEAGDRLVLMSDGIYNIVTEERLADILKRYPDVNQAASVIERVIRDSNHPQQDNYTAIVLGF